MRQSTLNIPAHVALIMDGNGRWAERQGRARPAGHVAGARAMRTAVEHCARAGVQHLTVYAFSSDNWSRPTGEVRALLELFTAHFRTQANALARAGIRVSAIGQRTRLPIALQRAIATAESRTAHGHAMHLRVAIDYSSRTAIQQAHGAAPSAPTLVADGMAHTEVETLLPPVDLLVRTGGERRLSDFLLWECAYAELLFLDVLFPDLSPAILDEAFADYARRERRFGAIPQRVSA